MAELLDMTAAEAAAVPTITITCHPQPVPGQPGQAVLMPQLSWRQVPGGWTSVHQLLAQVLHMVAIEMVKETGVVPQRIAVVPGMPGELLRQ